VPFKKIGRDTYVSPSGRKFNGAQVRLYYATGGFSKPAKSAPAKAKTRQA
jgi:hypothetical protein